MGNEVILGEKDKQHYMDTRGQKYNNP